MRQKALCSGGTSLPCRPLALSSLSLTSWAKTVVRKRLPLLAALCLAHRRGCFVIESMSSGWTCPVQGDLDASYTLS